MNELEKKMFESIALTFTYDDAAKAAAKIALEEIKEAFVAGVACQAEDGTGEQDHPDINEYLKQKGYE